MERRRTEALGKLEKPGIARKRLEIEGFGGRLGEGEVLGGTEVKGTNGQRFWKKAGLKGSGSGIFV
jgi:hypothetical protein